MLNDDGLKALEGALKALQAGDAAPWRAIAPLARVPQTGADVSIDFTAAYRLGAPVITARPAALPLTTRQRQIAEAVARGLSNKSIAQELSIRPATVKDHLKAIYTRLGINSRAELAARLHGAQA